jgi:hypothetical protein
MRRSRPDLCPRAGDCEERDYRKRNREKISGRCAHECSPIHH